MSRYAGLRRARMARHLSGADGDYFDNVVSPLLAAKYTELQAAGQAPFYKTFEQAMSNVLNHKAETGNIVFGDARAFIYPPLNEAHKNGGDNALYAKFAKVITALNTRLNSYIEDNPKQVQTVLDAGEKIDRLNNSIVLRAVEKLSSIFNRSNETGLVTKKAQVAYNTIMGITPYYSHPMDVRMYDPRGSIDVSPDSLVAFHQHREKLTADMPPADYGPITLKAPELPDQTTTITAPKLPPQKPIV